MDVGTELARARALRGLSIADVAEATRIRPSLVEAIERNEFGACGELVFARGYVRAIASLLGLDGAVLLGAMGSTNAPSALEPAEPESLDIWQLRARARQPSEARWWTVVALLGLVIVIALLAYARSSETDVVLPSATASASTPVSPKPSGASGGASARPAAPAASVAGAIVLDFTCVDTAWVRVSSASGILFEATMRAGTSKRITSDTDVSVRIGNAAGIRLTVNGVNQGTLGRLGAIYSHTFSSE